MTEMDDNMLVCIVWSNFLALTSSLEKVTTSSELQSSHDGLAESCAVLIYAEL